MEISSSDLDRIRRLYEQGLYLQAWRASLPFGPFRGWSGTRARVLAGRMAANLGAPRLAAALHLFTWRADRSDPEAIYYAAYRTLDRRGPLAAWEFLRPLGDLSGIPDPHRSDLAALRAEIAAHLRDFDTAEHWMARAEERSGDRGWTGVIRARLLEAEDRYPEALEALQRTLAAQPWYRPAVQACAHLLQLLDRDGDALQLLRDAAARLESGPLMAQLSALQAELALHADVRASLDRYSELSPLLEKIGRQWLAARRSDCAYACGDLADAAAWAARADLPFYHALAGRLVAPAPRARRVLLPVGFVRQHHVTCAPATLSALSRFWSMPADHLAVAEKICYDGTPAQSERRWAEENGWIAREFTVTWESAVALLDRGIPFTLTTVDPGNAHLQAMIGYDSLRRTFLIRDPFERTFAEFLDEETLSRYRSSGPRGMALVPRAEARRLADLDLPEAPLWDLFTAALAALERHDRPAAWKAWEALEAAAPGHRLSLQARRAVAAYDADRVTQARCVDELLRLFPDDANFLLARLEHLRELGRREERLKILRLLCEGGEAAPLFRTQYARELSADDRRHDEAMDLLREALGRSARDADCHHALAGLLWNRGRREEALEVYRFAACLEDKNEDYAESYFIASRHLRQTAAALLFLRSRFRRFGARSAAPARTLFWAFEQLEQVEEGLRLLDEAVALRPADGDLMLYAADARARYGDIARAKDLVARAEGHCHPALRLRAAAQLASYQGGLREALALWRQAHEADPVAADAQAAVARLLAETEGRSAALAALRAMLDRFPYHAGLHQTLIEWLREDEPAAYEAAIRRLVELHPQHAWARRELAALLLQTRRAAEGAAEAEEACRLEPSAPASHFIRARALDAAGRPREAQEARRAAIRISADYDIAIAELVRACASPGERRDALAFVHGEFVRQVIFGDGLLAFRELARDTLEPPELLAMLEEAGSARPDLWHAASALGRQLAEMGRLDPARDVLRRAVDRFPLVPRLWVDLAYVEQLRGDHEGEFAALRQALRINPSWGVAARALAAAHERAGGFAEARRVMEQATAAAPLDVANHGDLAWMLRKTGEKEAALARLEQAVRLEPGFEWAWATLAEWSREWGRPGRPADLARELARRRSGDARSWLVLARMLAGPEALEERLAALAKAMELDPRNADARNLRAALLAESGRFDEARRACAGDPPSLELRGRAAWIEALRGDRARAVELMKAVVADDPSYAWGWSQLAEWHRAADDHKEYLEAARAMLRLSPQNEVALGHLGEAQLRLGDRKAGREALRRAVELVPSFAIGGALLFDASLEDGDLAEAARVLGVLRTHVGGAPVLMREVRLASKRGDRAAAEAALRELALLRLEDRGPLETAVSAMRDAGWIRPALGVLRSALDDPEAAPEAAFVWAAGRLGLLEIGACRRGLRDLRDRPEAWAQGAAAWLEGAAERGHALGVRCFLHRERERLRAHAMSWASAGYALSAVNAQRACVRWLSDWESRRDVRPWMLVNLVGALRALGRVEEAARVGRGALALPPDGSMIGHRLWLAFDEAVAGRRAEEAGTDEAPLDSYFRSLLRMTQAVLHAGAGEHEKAKLLLARARSVHPGFRQDGALWRTHARAVRALVRARGGWAARLWALRARLF